MTTEEFLVQLEDLLMTDVKLTLDTKLDDLEEWDSLAKMAVMAFLQKNFHKETKFKDYKELHSVLDLVKMAGLIHE